MKKFDLLKILGIAFAITLLLSWVIPAGSFSYGSYQSLDKTLPIGLFDIVKTPTNAFTSFAYCGLIFLAIGGFYGVLNKIGVYSKLVDSMSNKWKGKENKFLVLTIIVFALLSSIVGLQHVIFILVPLFAAALLALSYNKITSFAATVGAILVGQIAAVLGNEYYLQYFAKNNNTEINSLFLVKAILFVVITVIYVLLVNKKAKPADVLKCKKCDITVNGKTKFCPECGTKLVSVKEEKEVTTAPMLEKTKTKKSTTPAIIVLVITIVLLVLGMYGWSHAFNITFFDELYSSIMEFKIGDYAIMSNLFSSVPAFGNWGNYEFVSVLLLASLLLGWIYSLKFDELVEGFIQGMKKIALAALCAVLASTIFYAIYLMLYSNGGSFVETIINKILGLKEGFNWMTSTLSSVVMSFFYNDFSLLLRISFFSAFGAYDVTAISTASFITEAISGLVNVIAPTSIFLLAGLKYMEVPYKDWAKYIWKFLLIVFAIVVIVAAIVTMV